MSDYPSDAEFGFELLVCRWAEQKWPPHDAEAQAQTQAHAQDDCAVIISRQRGTQHRRWDTIVLECDPAGLSAREQFGPRTLDSDLLRVVRWAPETWTWYRDAIPQPDFPWRYVRAAVHRAADRGVINTRRQGNRIEMKRVAEYPRWLRRIIAIENKPDLDASAARTLRDQLQRDVETALADEVWVATTATNNQVEPVLLKDLPAEVGILTFDFDPDVQYHDWAEASVIWHPTKLDSTDPQDWSKRESSSEQQTNSDENEERNQSSEKMTTTASNSSHREGKTSNESSSGPQTTDATTTISDTERVIDTERYRQRLILAERAYGAGWRSYHETMRPDCRHFELRRFGNAGVVVPYCAAKQRSQTAAECAGDCAEFEPEPPNWRMRGWPLTGGPGARIKQLLTTRRERVRERETSQ
ncbi:MAG: hypothetical protein J07HQW1_02218 [Haloquadratum walsbyi J07HQW1]|uniref:Uncharacterized protein n=1 Tax=Haloquadratum walsbyi J07HQW1 TaxID=1238424 RepID=U1N6U3_9EURY|nr:MAG: hypothetical protein J07HQW1_02218 [Haloquadratum walsbyi J07HQW1]